MRKVSVLVVFLVAVALVLSACAPSTTGPATAPVATAAPATTAAPGAPTQPAAAPTQPAAAPTTPIKVGVIFPQNGIYAESGIASLNGFKMGIEELGSKAGGRPIQLIVEDDESKPETGVSKAKKLVEVDKVDLLAGAYSTAVTMAILDYVIASKVPMLIPAGGIAKEISYAKKSPYVWRTSALSGQYILGFPSWLYNELKYKTLVVIAPDNTYGKEAAICIKKEFEKAGGKVIQEMYPPAGTPDYAPFIGKIDTSASAVFADLTGTDAVRFVQQYKEYNMWAKLPLVGSALIMEEALAGQGEAAVGIYGSMNYSYNAPTPENTKFAEAYKAKYGKIPGHISPAAYEGAKAMIMAIDAVKGNVADKDGYVKALSEVTFMGPRGEFKFEKSTQTVYNTNWIRKVIKKDGEITYDNLKSIPNIAPSDVAKMLGEQ